MTIILTIWRFLRPILTFGVTLPVWLFIAAAVWLWVDKTSAVRAAVDNAVTELAAGAEIEGLKARLAAQEKLAAFERGKAEALAAANARFDSDRQIAELESERLANELEELRSQPAPDGCVVTPDLLDRLR